MCGTIHTRFLKSKYETNYLLHNTQVLIDYLGVLFYDNKITQCFSVPLGGDQ